MKTFPFFLILIFIAGCYTPRYVYSPPAHHVPLLSKKGDAVFSAFYSTSFAGSSDNATKGLSIKNFGADVQCAYAFQNHWALQADYNLRTETNDGNYLAITDSSSIKYRRNSISLGVGYFSGLPERKTFHWQVFAGLGYGKFNFTDNSKLNGTVYQRYHNSEAIKFYLQPAIIIKPAKYFYTAFSSRFSLLKFYNIKTDYNSIELNNYKLDSLTASAALFWEPGMIANFGFKKIPAFTIEFQAGLCLLFSTNFIDTRPFNFSAGIKTDFKKIFGKSSAKKPG